MSEYQKSRDVFNSYAGMPAPYLPGPEIQGIQIALSRWQNYQFPGSSDLHLALGIAEECGEFFEALAAGDYDDTVDAVGDILIYATQLATSHRLDFETILNHQFTAEQCVHSARFDRMLMEDVGAICHVVLKAAQGIRGFNDSDAVRVAVFEGLCDLVRSLSLAAPFSGIREMYTSTAKKVLQRDWRSDPLSGGQ